MAMKCAGEIMMPLEAFPYIPYWFTLRQALAEMEDAEIESRARRPIPWVILVFSARNQLLGMVRLRDILEQLKPVSAAKAREYLPTADMTEDPDLYRLRFSPGKSTQELKKQIERQILDFMTPINQTVDCKDHAFLVIHIMIDRNLNFIPVTQNGQIVGIIYAEDALHEVIENIV